MSSVLFMTSVDLWWEQVHDITELVAFLDIWHYCTDNVTLAIGQCFIIFLISHRFCGKFIMRFVYVWILQNLWQNMNLDACLRRMVALWKGLFHCLWNSYCCWVQFSSGWYLRAQESPYALHPVSGVSPMLPLKQFQCWSGWQWPFLVLSRKIVEHFSFYASLLQAINGEMSLALCPLVVSQDPQHFRSSETQATCDGLLFPPGYQLCHFLWLQHVQDSTPVGLLSGDWTMYWSATIFWFLWLFC